MKIYPGEIFLISDICPTFEQITLEVHNIGCVGKQRAFRTSLSVLSSY